MAKTLGDELRAQAEARELAQKKKAAKEAEKKRIEDQAAGEEDFTKIVVGLENRIRKEARKSESLQLISAFSKGSFGDREWKLYSLLEKWASENGMHMHYYEGNYQDIDYPVPPYATICWADHGIARRNSYRY